MIHEQTVRSIRATPAVTTVLITGATGFSGRHLAARLATDPTVELHLTARRTIDSYSRCDLANAGAVFDLLRRTRPHQIYHLAGTFTNQLDVDVRANVGFTQNLIAAARRLALHCRILLIGSAAEYGTVCSADNPIGESQPLRPVSPYGWSKLGQTRLMRAAAAPTVELLMARTFNLFGAGMSPRLIVGRVHAWIAEHRRGGTQPLVLGPLDQIRDYLPIVDAADEYRRIMRYGRPGEIYNVGAGRPTPVRTMVHNLLRQHHITPTFAEERAIRAPVGPREIIADRRKLDALPKLPSWPPRSH